MNKRWILLMIIILAGGSLLLWWGLSKNNSTQKEENPSSMKAQTQAFDLMSTLSTQSTEYIVQSGDSLTKIARQYNTTIDLLQRLNELQGDLIRVGQKLKVPPGKFDVLVNKSEKKLELRLNGQSIKSYAVSTGKDNSTPTGDFTITVRLKDPVWYKTGAVIPHGSPENILGSRWLGISSKEYPKGYGIHGTVEPDKIGQSVTAGCVRMRKEEVEELYTLLPEGTSVKIVDRTEPS